MSCAGEGATHHAACDCREAAHRAEVSQLRDKLADAEKDRDWAYGEFEAYGSPFELRDRAEKADAEVGRLRALLEAAEVDKIRILDVLDAANMTSAESVAGSLDLIRAIAGDRSTSAKTDPQK